jgi:hypothetical protein
MKAQDDVYRPMPVLLARDNGNETWSVWCPYCLTEHTHGAGPGHRVAHCIAACPFTDSGYILALPGSPFLRKLRRSRPVVGGGTVVLANGRTLRETRE